MFVRTMLAVMIVFAALTAAVVPAQADSGIELTFDENYSYLTITVDQSDVERALERGLSQGVTPALVNPDVELEAGQLYVSGEYLNVFTNRREPGEMTVSFEVVNGELEVVVTSLMLNGYPANPEIVADINDNIAAGIAGNAGRHQGRGELYDVTITPSDVSIVIRTPLR